ncbi:hypothetical protein [Comamonas testosteroni]|uniref:hypothetical protein n=1 Tax=Comamonas testosteroni TaxID=285 RepID=UPI001E3FDA7C|nr:hypothetical protein [Comamonas testosteroni]
MADISGNIGKDSRHFGNDCRRKCYYIYNDYLPGTGSKAFRAALSGAGFGIARRSVVWVASIAKPFVRLLSFSTHVILTFLRINEFACPAMTEQEIAAGLEQGGSGFEGSAWTSGSTSIFHLDVIYMAYLMSVLSICMALVAKWRYFGFCRPVPDGARMER